MTEFLTLRQSMAGLSKLVRIISRHIEISNLRRQVEAERRALRDLSDDALKDLGITRENALREANRKLDDVPEHRIPRHLR